MATKEQIETWVSLGNDYYFGENGKIKDEAEGVKYYKKAALLGNIEAQYYLGEAYENGFGASEDLFAAAFWYAKAALGGDADGEAALEDLKESCDISALEELAKIDCLTDCETAKTAKEFFSLGFNYYNGKGMEKNYEKAVACYLRAAWQGEVGAICNLGLCFENGRGVTKNIELAIYCYEKAANEGNATAQCNLGVLYYYGKKIAKDYKKALYWYKKAEAQGYGRAMYELGVIYGQGVAVKKDLVAAKKYFLKAKEKGYKNAQAGLDWVEKLVAEERRIAQEKEAQRKAAEQESKRWAEEKRREEESRRKAAERKRIEQEEKRRKEEEQRAKDKLFERFSLNLEYGIGGYYGERLTSSNYSFSAFRGEYKVSVRCSVELSRQYYSGSYQNGIESKMKDYVEESVRSQMERAGLSGSASIEISIDFTVR